MNYYNEFDSKAAAWLRALITHRLIPAGDVDTRSITEIKPNDLLGYTQCHFFAGIAGWPLALQLAGWPSTRPVWTGSCPCQPFSCAGAQRGTDDERHLWPVFRELIRECRPANVFGEQVASALGRDWLAGVRSDLEGLGYAVGAADLCAASVGAPHIRQRLYWVAHQQSGGLRIDWSASRQAGHSDECRASSGMADTKHQQCEGCLSGRCEEPSTQGGREAGESARRGEADGLANAHIAASGDLGFWSDSEFIPCRDGLARRVPSEPALFPLADGIPGRVGLLRGAGNAIVPPLAARFIEAFLSTEPRFS